MKSIFFGSILFMVFVGNPMWSNILANIAVTTDLDIKSKFTLLVRASTSNSCNMKILQTLGDLASSNGYAPMAAWAYERATKCEPQQAAFHFMLGEAMFVLNKNGMDEIDQAIFLEPNNPIFKGERDRLAAITKPQSQSQSH